MTLLLTLCLNILHGDDRYFPVPRYEICFTLRIKFGANEECVILVFSYDSVRLVKIENANSISFVNIMMTAYFNA